MKIKKTLGLLLLFLVCCPILFAQTSGADKSTIKEVTITGLKLAPRNKVSSLIREIRGKELTQILIVNTTKKLYSLGFFEDISVETQELEEGVALIYRFQEKKQVYKIEFEGNKQLDEKKLSESITTKLNNFVDIETIQADLQIIKDLYIKEGYSRTKIVHRLEEEEQGLKLTYQILENNRVYLTKINITGSKFFLPIDLERIMRSSEIDCFSWLTESGRLDQKKIDIDLQIIRQEYYKNGFIDLQISKPKIEIILSPDFATASVSFEIEEGEQYFVEGIFLESLDEDEDLIFSEQEILDTITLKADAVYNPLQQNQDRIAVNNLYQDSGYAFSSVRVRRRIEPTVKRVSLLFQVLRQEKVYINRIEFVGNQQTRDDIVRRELTIYDGELFNGRKIRESQAKLGGLGYFSPGSGVSVQREINEVENEINYNFRLQEIQTGNFSGGATYSTTSGLGLNVSVTKSNFLGTGRRISFSYESAENTEKGSVSFTEPYLFGSRWRSTTSISDEYYGKASSNLDYDRDVRAFSQNVSYPVWQNWRVGLGYSFGETVRSSFDEGSTSSTADTRTQSITGNLVYSTVNNPYFPSDGNSSRFSFTQYGGNLGGTEHYRLASYEYKYFENVFSDRIIFYYRLRLSKLFQLDQNLIPNSSRFTLGGSNSIRGFNNYEVRGPTDIDEWSEDFDLSRLEREDPEAYQYYITHLYGTEEILSNIEINFPLAREGQNLRGLFFYDLGNVFAEDRMYEIVGIEKDYSYLRSSYGVGVRIITPLGVMKFDYGIKINPIGSEDNSKFEFTIGGLF